MSSILLVAVSKNGGTAEFRLYDQQKQYTIGRQADISLQELESETSKRARIYPVSGFVTCIEGAWYFRCAKGMRRGTKAVKVNGKEIDASHAEVWLRHGYTISFGDNDDIVVTVFEDIRPETLVDRLPELGGLFDRVSLEFESLNDLLRRTFGLRDKANTAVIMSRLEERGLWNAVFEYNLARGLRNMIAHPSPGLVRGIKREYVHQALRAIEAVRSSVQTLTGPQP